MNHKEFDKALKNAKWKPSERGNSHEYVLDRDYPGLVHIVQAKLKAEGVRERYKHYMQTYWYYKGYKYWTMPGISGLPKAIVLNRTKARRVKHLILHSFSQIPFYKIRVSCMLVLCLRLPAL